MKSQRISGETREKILQLIGHYLRCERLRKNSLNRLQEFVGQCLDEQFEETPEKLEALEEIICCLPQCYFRFRMVDYYDVLSNKLKEEV